VIKYDFDFHAICLVLTFLVMYWIGEFAWWLLQQSLWWAPVWMGGCLAIGVVWDWWEHRQPSLNDQTTEDAAGQLEHPPLRLPDQPR